MKETRQVTLIDGDGMCYFGKPEDTYQDIINKVDTKIQTILEETEADYYLICISKGRYFRHELTKSKSTSESSYKGHRKHDVQKWNKMLKEYLIAQYGAIWWPNVEADDMISYLSNNSTFTFVGRNGITVKIASNEDVHIATTISAVDKDILYGLPGRHLNYNKKTQTGEWDIEWVEISVPEASLYIWEQMVQGDPADSIKGLPMKGKAWTTKHFAGKMLGEVQHIVFDEYIKEYGTEKGIYEFQKTYRQLYLLNNIDDFMREAGFIPNTPIIQKVNKEKFEERDF